MSPRIRVLRPVEAPVAAAEGGTLPEPNPRPQRPDISIYRPHTIALLRRFFRLSMEVGRLPSLLGREFFRARVSSYKVQSFEDAVIFVHDVEQCLDQLDPLSKALLARVVLQEYTEEETARLLHCTRRHVVRLYPEALDRLTEIFLRVRLLRRVPQEPGRTLAVPKTDSSRPSASKTLDRVEACQETKFVIFRASA
ncbi:MAG: hypothetical protein ACE14M_00360 [Terriglobales bacterium]